MFRGPIELGCFRHHLECRSRSGGLELSVARLGRFAIDPGGERIRFEAAATSTELSGRAELALGPALTLALALQDVWCLHAGAVELDGELLAFLGSSGVGKSTLAGALPTLAGSRLRPAADDLLPVTLKAGGTRALPRFPQLKCPPDRQPGAGLPQSMPLAAIYLLNTDTAAGDVAVEPVTGSEAVLALVRHTHSARLFSRELLRRHTEFCACLASRVPIRRLTYARVWESLPRVEAALTPGAEASGSVDANVPGDGTGWNSYQRTQSPSGARHEHNR